VKSKDVVSSLFWLILGAGITYGGYDLDLGSLRDPGSGFIFFWVGLVMMGLSLSILIQALMKRGEFGELHAIWSGVRWKTVVWVLVSLVIYAYAFNLLGFILSTVSLLIFLFKIVEPQRWSIASAGAILITITAYVVFKLLLGSQLPQGLLGIG
jgi:putative tricarboxylic transport membrane protein